MRTAAPSQGLAADYASCYHQRDGLCDSRLPSVTLDESEGGVHTLAGSYASQIISILNDSATNFVSDTTKLPYTYIAAALGCWTTQASCDSQLLPQVRVLRRGRRGGCRCGISAVPLLLRGCPCRRCWHGRHRLDVGDTATTTITTFNGHHGAVHHLRHRAELLCGAELRLLVASTNVSRQTVSISSSCATSRRTFVSSRRARFPP